MSRQRINMDNKIALVWRENVVKLMDHCGMKATDLSRYCERSQSTLQSCFGGNSMKAAASVDTIRQIERGFGLTQGDLNNPRFDPAAKDAKPLAATAAPPAQLATLSIPIPADKLEQIMKILQDE